MTRDVQSTSLANFYGQLALVVYEYAVTMDREINLVWRRKLTAPSLILLLSRWFMLLGPITGNIPLTSLARCRSFLLATVFSAANVRPTYQTQVQLHPVLSYI